MLFRKNLIFLFLILTFHSAGGTVSDSLRNALSHASDDNSRSKILSELAAEYFYQNNFDSAESCAQRLAILGRKTGNNKTLARAYEIRGMISDSRSDFSGAISLYDSALALYDKSGDPEKSSLIHQDKANAYYSLGANDKALQHYMLSLKIREQRGDSSGIASSYMGISNVYNQMHRNDLSLSYAKKALRLKEKFAEEKMVSWLLNNIGAIYLDLKDTTAALPYYYRSIELKKKLNDEYGLATTYKNIATIQLKKRQFIPALSNYRLALRMRTKLNPDDTYEMSICYDDIGSVYMEMQQYDSAEYYIEKSIELAERIHSFDLLTLPYYNMAQVLSKKGEYKLAYEFALKHLAAKDSTLSSETNALMNEMAGRYENEKKEQQIAMQELKIRDQKKSNVLFFAISVFALLLSVVMFRGYLNKKKANLLLEEKNILIEQQKEIVEEKNKDITDSIHYAQRIQRAILPPADYQKKIIPDSFVLFKPKDIVSGDFYWIEKSKDKIMLAVIDCTGHGVPGAFMTFVAYSLLNEAVLEHGIDEPAAILNEMRRNLNKMLRQKNDAEALKDGMDISVCALDLKKLTLEFAGAYNPLWLIRENELIETTADKQPIGVFLHSELRPFTNHIIPLRSGDALYLFTDGYADQFGGPKGKKFKYKSLKQLFLSIHTKPLKEQHSELGQAFDKWRGSSEQVDDVCILGVRIPA